MGAGPGDGQVAAGTVLVSLGLGGTWARTGHAEHCPDINPVECATRHVPPEWHDVALSFVELRLQVQAGLTKWLAFDLRWSLRLVDQRFVLRDLETRQPIAPPFGTELHHRNETLVGLTDPWLSLRGVQRVGRFSIALRGGVTLPLGDTVDNPFQRTREGKVHQHVQLGTGTFNPFVEIQVLRRWTRLAVAASLLGRTSLYDNRHGFRAGSLLLGGLHTWSDLWTRQWRFGLGVAINHEEPERWNGLVETEGNLGRTDFLVDLSVGYQLPQRFSITVSARVPFFTIVRGDQLATPAFFEVAVARPFDL